MIYLKNYISKDNIHFYTEPSKNEILLSMINSLKANNKIHDFELFKKSVLERENILSTGIGNSVAVPHVKLPGIEDFFISIGVHKEGVNWDSMDDKPVNFIFLIGGNDNHEFYLRILSKLVLIIKNEEVRKKILECNSADEVIQLFDNY